MSHQRRISRTSPYTFDGGLARIKARDEDEWRPSAASHSFRRPFALQREPRRKHIQLMSPVPSEAEMTSRLTQTEEVGVKESEREREKKMSVCENFMLRDQ